MAPVPLYDSLAVDYDRFVDWHGRLAHELPFFLSLFARAGVRRVLDSACGTGHHALALARHGYDVVGTDLSAAMVERARENAARAGVEVPFVQASLGNLAGIEFLVEGKFDAALCLGNSLPHLLSYDAVSAALADFAAVLRPGGLLVVQNRNFDKVWAERQRFMPPQSQRDADDEWIFVRFYDFGETEVVFNMVRLRRSPEGWAQDVDATRLRPLFADDLALGLHEAGFEPVDLYGGYDRSAFDPDQSGDLLAVAYLARS
ncbi:MAG: class I SAM-dependent methyltransferase [Anaerolineae bacterium]|nr:class I SAM-dependent methyltransferase [Anaerolineae bacterium]